MSCNCAIDPTPVCTQLIKIKHTLIKCLQTEHLPFSISVLQPPAADRLDAHSCFLPFRAHRKTAFPRILCSRLQPRDWILANGRWAEGCRPLPGLAIKVPVRFPSLSPFWSLLRSFCIDAAWTPVITRKNCSTLNGIWVKNKSFFCYSTEMWCLLWGHRLSYPNTSHHPAQSTFLQVATTFFLSFVFSNHFLKPSKTKYS